MAPSLHFRLWTAITFVAAIGLILWVGVLSDSSGQHSAPGAGSVLYVAGVVFVTALLAYADRNRDAPGRNRKG